jgi:hypothetical protein
MITITTLQSLKLQKKRKKKKSISFFSKSPGIRVSILSCGMGLVGVKGKGLVLG